MAGNSLGIMSAHAVAYESIMIGLFGIHYAEQNEQPSANEKSVHIQAGFSRDGFAYDRTHKPLIHEDSDMFYLVPAGGGFLVEKNELIFFFGARRKNNDQFSAFFECLVNFCALHCSVVLVAHVFAFSD